MVEEMLYINLGDLQGIWITLGKPSLKNISLTIFFFFFDDLLTQDFSSIFIQIKLVLHNTY